MPVVELGREEAERRWARAVRTYCPVSSADGFWCQSIGVTKSLPRQGWKIHVSATPINAAEVLEIVGLALAKDSVLFKAVASLPELAKLNCGLYYGYSQIGKVLTVYPESPDRCVSIARRLANRLRGQPGPAVPYERRVLGGSPVFARYGVFVGGGESGTSLERLDGAIEPDRRDRHPPWVEIPPGLFAELAPPRGGPLAGSYRAFGFISQRGKGGVYRALDLSGTPARLCVLKEGRRHGETDLDGQDGYSRVCREAEVLSALAEADIAVPRVYSTFEQGGHKYLVLEWISGGTLADYVGSRRDDPTPWEERVDLCLRLATLVARVHRSGWVWRDLKSANILIDVDHTLRPIDFEGAARQGSLLRSPWGSPGHLPPEWLDSARVSVAQDKYALGIVMREVLTNTPVTNGVTDRSASIDPSIPSPIHALVDKLTSDEPSARPSASAAASLILANRRRVENQQRP